MNLLLASAALVACWGCADAPVGSESRPFKMYFVPSVDAETIATSAEEIVDHVERHVSRALYGREEGFHIESAIPASYVAVVEAFGTGRADFAALNTFSYVLAKDVKKYPVEALVTVVRGEGETSYCGQIIARADSGIEDVRDLAGKRFAFTDPASTAGYILPKHLLEREGIHLGQETFAMKHDNVVTQVYQGQVDAGATYYSPPKKVVEDGREVEVVRDARARVLTQFPDVVEKVKIVGFTDETPNDAWVLRSDAYADPEMQRKVRDAVREALLAFAETAEGKEVLEKLYNISGLAPVEDSAYDGIRKLVLASDVDLEKAAL